MSFLIIATSVLFLMQATVGLWFYFSFPALGWKIPAVIVPLLMTVFTCCTMWYTRTHYGPLESAAYYAAYTWAGLVFIGFSIVAFFAVIYAVCALCRIPAKSVIVAVSLIAIGISALVSLYGGMRLPVVRHIDIFIPGAPDMTIAVISDSHLGTGVSVSRFQKALHLIEAENPDALCVLGDLFEYGRQRDKYAQALARLNTKYGSFGVLGNHEYYVGYDRSLDFYKKSGITLLQNQVHLLPNGLQIIGVNDIKTSHVTAQQLEKLLETSDPARTRILLSHQPLLTDTVAKHAVDLMLSGHTHNGQIFPFNYLVKLIYPYLYGLYEIGPDSKLYVTSGMFYWGIPLRFLTPSEIPIVHLKGHD